MENNLQVFNFEKKEVRTVLINDEIWFVAKDICDVLTIQNSSRAIEEQLDEDEKLKYVLSTPGQNREMWVINESGAYALIIRSNKPEAKKFRKWLTSEVIPSIMKTGSYSVEKQLSPAEFLLQQAQMLVDLEQKQREQGEKISNISRKLENFNGETGYRTIVAYCNEHKIDAPLKMARIYGQKIASYCKDNSLPIGKIPDERWGMVNSYPVKVLKEFVK